MSHDLAAVGFVLQQADDLTALDFAGLRFVEQQVAPVGGDGVGLQQQVPDIRLASEHRQT